MFMPIEQIKPNTAVASVIESIGSALVKIALRVGTLHRVGGGSVQKIVGADIGIDAKASVIRSARQGIGAENWRCLKNWGGSALSADFPIRAFSTSTTLIQRKKTNLRIEDTQHQSGYRYGKRKWTIFKSFAPIVIALKPISKHGALTNFFHSEPPKKAEQEAMDL